LDSGRSPIAPALFRVVLMAGAFAALGAASLSAQETPHYPNGTSGLKAGTTPPPGYYWLMYNRYYTADKTMDADGNEATAPGGGPLGFDLAAFANVHRIIQITDKKIFGADYGWNVVIPIVDASIDIPGYGVKDDATRISDFNAEPFVMEWHEERYDFGFVYGFFAPSADRDDTHPAWTGKDYSTNYAGLAGTYYFDEKRTWTLSFLSRYEVNSDRKEVDLRAGDNFSFEWGLGKTVLPLTDVGVSGFCSWQTTDDKGSAAVNPGVRDRVFGIGPEVHYFSPKHNFGYHLRYWWEFGAVDRTQGQILTFTLVKPF
jgi:hypothetical protein